MFNLARNFLRFLRWRPSESSLQTDAEFHRAWGLPRPPRTAELPPPSHLKPAPKGKCWCLQLDGTWKLVKSVKPTEFALEQHRWPSMHRAQALNRMVSSPRKSKRRSHKKRRRA